MTPFEQTLPEHEKEIRLSGIQNALSENEMDGVLILQKADMFYYTGTAQQGWLYIPRSGDPLLMVFKDFIRAKQESGMSRVIPLISPKVIPDIIKKHKLPEPANLGLELDVLTANQYMSLQKIFDRSNLHDFSMPIRLQRAIKSEFEIQLMRKASDMADKVAEKVPDILREGLTEIEFAGKLEAYARSLGHQGLIRMRMWDNDLFYGHIMSGPGAAIPSCFASPTGGKGINPSIAQGPGFQKIKRNEAVLVDYVFVLDGYISDHTRIFSIGSVSDELSRAHDTMLEIQEKARTSAIPGSITGDLYHAMIQFAEKRGYQDQFMGTGDRKIRFTGHGVGLELDEFPFIAKGQKLTLKKGMTLALEPKIVLPGKGVAGIENTFLVTEKGLESLTTYPDTITIL